MTYRIIGKCSECGGPVTLENQWYSTEPQRPRCRNCGGIEEANLPIIKIKPAKEELNDKIV